MTTTQETQNTTETQENLEVIIALDEVLAENGFIFVPLNPAQLGRSDSAHEVIFGDLVAIDATQEFSAIPAPRKVAIKYFDGKNGRSVQRANNELRNYRNAISLGYKSFTSLDDISVVSSEESEFAFLVTNYESGLTPLNTKDWQVDRGTGEFESRANLLARMAESVADMHASGIIHGDLQIKNMVMDDFGEFWLIDLEKSQVSKKGINDEPRTVKHAARDIKMLLDSILSHGFMPNNSVGDVYETLVHSLVIPYFEKLCSNLEVSPEEMSEAEFMDTIPGKIFEILNAELSDQYLRGHHGDPLMRKSEIAHWVDRERS